MASNGLVANPTKTTLLIMNNKEEEEVEVKVGNVQITQEKASKLLEVSIDDDLGWKNQVYGKGGLIASLNQRTHLIRRLRNHIGAEKLRKVVDSLWTSKLWYGLQLWASVRMKEMQPKTKQGADVQKIQNRLLKVLENKRVTDKIPVKTMLENQKMMSVNQTAAQIKLLEMWKAKNTEDYPLKIEFQTTAREGTTTQGDSSGKAIEVGKTNAAKKSFIGDATRTWNRAPDEIKLAKTISSAKQRIKVYCKTLPI